MTVLVTRNKAGNIVLPGDTVTDFRGDTAEFVAATRPRDGHRTGKVAVSYGTYTEEDAERLGWVTAGQDINREFYDTVFDLAVTAE